MKIAQNGHLLHFRRKAGIISVQRVIIMGDAKLVVGLDKRFIQHLLFLIGHIRDQQAEEDHQLLDLSGQHGVHVIVIHLIDQLHFRADGMADLHNIDAVRGSRSDFDELSADLTAGSLKFMALDGGNDIALDAAHSHTQGQQLQREGLTGTGGTAHGQVRILIDLRIEEVNDAKRVIVPVHTQQDTGIIRHFEAGEHIGGSSTAGQHIALCLLEKLWADLQKRHNRS